MCARLIVRLISGRFSIGSDLSGAALLSWSISRSSSSEICAGTKSSSQSHCHGCAGSSGKVQEKNEVNGDRGNINEEFCYAAADA